MSDIHLYLRAFGLLLWQEVRHAMTRNIHHCDHCATLRHVRHIHFRVRTAKWRSRGQYFCPFVSAWHVRFVCVSSHAGTRPCDWPLLRLRVRTKR
jgi:hypothetical protein